MNHQAEPVGNGLGEEEAAAGAPAPAADARGQDVAAQVTEQAAGATGHDLTEPAAEPTEQAAEVTEQARPTTGEPRVDAALTLLDGLAELPVTEHSAVFERVHAELTSVLGQLDPESADGG